MFKRRVFMTFLVVEESVTVRHLLCYLLLSLGIKGVPAADGEEARRELEARPEIEGAIVDIDNTKIGGLELIQALKGDPKTKNLTVIAHTIQSQKETVAALAQAGVEGCLLKPFDEVETYKKLKNILTRLTGPRQNQRRHIRVVPPADELLRLNFRVSGFPGLVSGKIINLSMGGLGVEIMTPLPELPENILKPEVFIERLQFSLPGGELSPSGVIIVIRGKIVGIRYTSLRKEDSIIMARYIFDKISS
jgi:CheY-like chemotaxis protein